MGKDDEARRIILARRARFVAAAVTINAAAAVAAACEPCLSPTGPIEPDGAVPDGGRDATPQPCLNVVQPPTDAGDAGDATPQPCLSPLPPDGGDDAGDGGDGG